MNEPGRQPERAFVGLGANLGDARATLISADYALKRLPQTRCLAVSSLYRSAPIEAQGPDFFNAVALLQTSLLPEALLDELQRIEAQHGRQRPFANAPRSLDLDLLLMGDRVLTSPRLSLPHPRLHQRAFVLLPLLELVPDLRIPGMGPAGAWLPAVADQRIERLGPWLFL